MGLPGLPLTQRCEPHTNTEHVQNTSTNDVIYTCTQAFELVCGCQWSDVLLELELLTRIARPALLQSNYKLVPGTSVLCTWYLRTLYLVPPYSVPGTSVLCTWYLHTLYLVPPYSVPGTSILCTWYLHTLCFSVL